MLRTGRAAVVADGRVMCPDFGHRLPSCPRPPWGGMPDAAVSAPYPEFRFGLEPWHP